LSKQEDLRMPFAPKSRDSRKKLRRWTFTAEMKLDSGQTQQFKLPGVVYGNSAEAQATAAKLLEQFKSAPDSPQDVQVHPQGHETVSSETVAQLKGMNDYANLFNKALFIMAERYRLASSTEKEIVTLVTEAVEEARIVLFPRLAAAQAKVAALDDGIHEVHESAAEVLVPAPPATEERPRMKLGIDAVNEVLNSPPEPVSYPELDQLAATAA
jgi:hypothetical protein